jgi:hypothetical protein
VKLVNKTVYATRDLKKLGLNEGLIRPFEYDAWFNMLQN